MNSSSARKLLGEAKGKEEASEAGSSEAGDIDDAKISPDGRWVSFLRAHDLWVVSTAGGEPRQLTHGGFQEEGKGGVGWGYSEEFDLGKGHLWGPDSSKNAPLQLDERQGQ